MHMAEAARLFARFVTQWQACDGTTVTLHAGTGGLELTATDIRGLPAGTNVRVAPATAITALAREAALAEGISISRRS